MPRPFHFSPGFIVKDTSDANVMLGIGLKIASVAIFVVMSALIKAAEGVPTGELVFFRSFFALVPILVFLWIRGRLSTGLSTKRPLAHFLRGLIGVAAMACGFFALSQLPLPEVITLNYMSPLMLIVLSALILKEQVRIYRWSAVTVGFIGVLIIVWPRLTLVTSGAPLTSGEIAGVFAALGGAVLAAGAMLTVRKLVQTETSATIVLYFSITSSLIALVTLPAWVMPEGMQWVYLIGAGVAGGIAQILLTECYRHADLSVIAPFEYTSLILSVTIGYLAFGDVPTVQMLVGGTIVVAAGLFIIMRERQLGLERAAARRVSTPQG